MQAANLLSWLSDDLRLIAQLVILRASVMSFICSAGIKKSSTSLVRTKEFCFHPQKCHTILMTGI